MIIRLLLLFALGYAIVRYLRMQNRRAAQRETQPPPRVLAPTPIAACALCGVHLPKVDTLTSADGRAYCSEAHRSLAHVQPG